MSFTMSAFLITWLAIALLAFAMSGLVRQVHALASSRQAVPFRTGPPIGAVLPDLNGAFRVSHPTKPTVLLFSEATCSTCAEPPAELARLASEHREMIQVGVVFRGKERQSTGRSLRRSRIGRSCSIVSGSRQSRTRS